jgi:short-subunit dehydrogenase
VNVFITGASSGIGAALALHYAEQGAALGLFARRAHELTHLAATLPSSQCAVYVGDVRDANALRHAASDYITRFGAPDIVIASAGISIGTSSAHSEDNDVFRAVLETNVLGLLFTFQPFLDAMQGARKGKLVGIASVAGFRGLPGSGPYSASKAAAISYLESLRVEMRGTGISVLTVCPGYVDTPMTARNPYPMPFRLQPRKAAALIAKAIARNRRFYVLPWQAAWSGKLLRILPRSLYDAVFARAPRKPRANA